jgi:hypothetical protein
MTTFRAATILSLLMLCAASASSEQRCIYRGPDGVFRTTESLEKIPLELRSSAMCGSVFESPQPPGARLDAPGAIKLEGNVRRISMSSSLGRVELRWPRKVEQLFGRTPERAVGEAMSIASRTIRKGFPPELQRISDVWQIVFMDEELPETQIPYNLVSNCHPAWMTGPANIYVVAQRVVHGCGKKRETVKPHEADAELAEVLVHEIGHVIEYFLLKGMQAGDRARAEGFATWFTQDASDASTLTRGSLRAENIKIAQKALARRETSGAFRGTMEDYAVASLLFTAIVDRRGIPGLMQVYDGLRSGEPTLRDAIQRALYWDDTRISKEVLRVLGSK